MGEIGQNLTIEVAPDQFSQPGSGSSTACDLSLQRQRDQMADRDGSKTQVHTQVARTFDGRKVAGLVIGIHSIPEVVQQLGCT
jgi:hypothetical protein